MDRFTMPMALALFIVFGCGAEPQGGSAESSAPERSTLPATESGTASAEDFLPAQADDGTLPRTLAGYTLLDPRPSESTREGGMFFEASLFHEEFVRSKPRAAVRPYSLDDAIFRIRYDDMGAPPWDELVQVALERYGKPFQQKDAEVIWIRDGSTLTLANQPGGEVSITIEDERETLNAYQRARELRQSQ